MGSLGRLAIAGGWPISEKLPLEAQEAGATVRLARRSEVRLYGAEIRITSLSSRPRTCLQLVMARARNLPARPAAWTAGDRLRRRRRLAFLRSAVIAKI